MVVIIVIIIYLVLCGVMNINKIIHQYTSITSEAKNNMSILKRNLKKLSINGLIKKPKYSLKNVFKIDSVNKIIIVFMLLLILMYKLIPINYFMNSIIIALIFSLLVKVFLEFLTSVDSISRFLITQIMYSCIMLYI